MTNLERAIKELLDSDLLPPVVHSRLTEALYESFRHPIAYPDRDLSSGLSWDGKVICGDSKSIDAVKLALDEQDNLHNYWVPETQALRKTINQAKEVLGA